ncbi:hypothetical protein L1987_27139 [Smallanthus sonchifolius]|uniref:Uncharacterized protein n=1 Tax=Smallanthus sonchifolius TaxID=185202 RepID=A0ACB9IDD8_9ASTR|nr:hypothetical protein L1987_27139 [Smallanthus sonchifolius]
MDLYPHPTKRNIQEALRWLVKDNQPGDSLVFYFSGHGLRQPDLFDDEIDGFDETICPLDFKTAGMIVDNEINDTIVRPLKSGVKLHAIIDACHSGTILDLPHVYSMKKNAWIDNRPPSGVFKGTSGGHAISISACEDYQHAAHTSAFSESGKQTEGAMTYTFRKVLLENTNTRVTYASLLASMQRDILAAKKKCFSLRGLFHRERLQEPLLSSSKEFDGFRMEIESGLCAPFTLSKHHHGPWVYRHLPPPIRAGNAILAGPTALTRRRRGFSSSVYLAPAVISSGITGGHEGRSNAVAAVGRRSVGAGAGETARAGGPFSLSRICSRLFLPDSPLVLDLRGSGVMAEVGKIGVILKLNRERDFVEIGLSAIEAFESVV